MITLGDWEIIYLGSKLHHGDTHRAVAHSAERVQEDRWSHERLENAMNTTPIAVVSRRKGCGRVPSLN